MWPGHSFSFEVSGIGNSWKQDGSDEPNAPNTVLLCSSFVMSAPTCVELQPLMLGFASCCVMLCCARFCTYCIVCLPPPPPPFRWVVCFHFMCGIKRPFEQRLPKLNERDRCFWKIEWMPAAEQILNYELAGGVFFPHSN